MRKVSAFAGIAFLGLSATACGDDVNETNDPVPAEESSDGADAAWFAENCATEVSDIRSGYKDDVEGEVLGQAITQGPIKPPSSLDESAQSSMGLYTHDELSGAMDLEREVTSSDVFCLEPSIEDRDRRIQYEQHEDLVEGDLHQDGRNFTQVRSPDHPEGIWISQSVVDFPDGVEVSDDMTEICPLAWWPDAEIIELDTAGKGEDIGDQVVESEVSCD